MNGSVTFILEIFTIRRKVSLLIGIDLDQCYDISSNVVMENGKMQCNRTNIF